jgi:dipeptidyl aminopeptidase/acylaminoacyl peptidase
LYKPENFDSKKKYPVIIHIYERLSQNLNKFQRPGATNGALDIAWFVSQGYLVFTPDIHYKVGYPGLSAYNSVIGAVKYLSKFKWVNIKSIGIQGHSFGGYETNFIISHSKLFAAGISSSGVSNFISSYGSLETNVGTSHQFIYEMGQNRLSSTMWENPSVYIENSPIFRVDKISAPMLTVANKKDGRVNFDQGVEFFTAMRRLGKRAWMLQYDDEDHGIDHKKCYKDYLVRSTQFFDHYLKGTNAPRWMLYGVPAKVKVIETGLELDLSDKTPGPGLPNNHNKKDSIKN